MWLLGATYGTRLDYTTEIYTAARTSSRDRCCWSVYAAGALVFDLVLVVGGAVIAHWRLWQVAAAAWQPCRT